MSSLHLFDPVSFQKKLFQTKEFNFERAALDLFKFQYDYNRIYQSYCKLLNKKPKSVNNIQTIPFLPISFFKSHKLKTTEFKTEEVFSSSGTSSALTSKHYVKEKCIYEQSFQAAFQQFYGDVKQYRILALLPSYLERKGSSLIYMVEHLIKGSEKKESGFFLNNFEELNHLLNKLAKNNEKTILIGVSFALLDFLEEFSPKKNSNLIVMETGGMKGRRKELIREDLHEHLKNGFQTNSIHSEYGMTELLSQAYSKGGGKFKCPQSMKVLIRKYDDPFSYAANGKTGGINSIDLANIYSCAFIQTDDLGKKLNEFEFEVLGRFDSTEVRGCNLMVS